MPAPWQRVALAMLAVGWGANQFAGLLAVYRLDGLSESFISSAVGVYAGGLIPALLVSALIADRIDRRAPVRLAVLMSAVGTVLLMLGAEHDGLLQLGRLVVGAATGAALAPGTAWLMDLSRDDGAGTGARRATIWLSLGFGGGPLIAGLAAQWSPYPEVLPYGLHLLLSTVAIVLVWNAPVQSVVHDPAGPSRAAEIRSVLTSRDFLGVVPVTAPWVFGVATTAFAIAPTAVTITTLPIATAALVTGTVLVAGVSIQPWAKQLEHQARGRTLWIGMLAASAGLVITALTFRVEQVWLLFLISALLGASYGLLLVGGLSRIELLTEPDDRATVGAIFYALTYLGFAAPYVFVLLTNSLLSPVTLSLLGALVAALSVVWVARQRLGGGYPTGGGSQA